MGKRKSKEYFMTQMLCKIQILVSINKALLEQSHTWLHVVRGCFWGTQAEGRTE